jgi:hypothetical protein
VSNGYRWPADRLAPCGTAAAARRHQRRGEPLDAACLAARRRESAIDAYAAATMSADHRERRNGLPFRPYVYQGTGADTLTPWMDVAS